MFHRHVVNAKAWMYTDFLNVFYTYIHVYFTTLIADIVIPDTLSAKGISVSSQERGQ